MAAPIAPTPEPVAYGAQPGFAPPGFVQPAPSANWGHMNLIPTEPDYSLLEDTTTPLKPCGTNSAHYQIAGAPIYDGVDINNRPRFTIPVKVGPLREAPGQDTKKRNSYKLKQIQALAPFSGRATLTVLGSNQQVSVSGVDQWWGKSGKQFLLKLTLTEKAHVTSQGIQPVINFNRSLRDGDQITVSKLVPAYDVGHSW